MRGILGTRGDEVGPAPTGAAPPVITALTGIRALAAGAVLAYHLRATLIELVPALRFANPWLIYGFVGVDVFFVLSGFIISYNYAQRFARIELREYLSYLRARLARIYPVHVVTLLLTAALIGLVVLHGTTVGEPRSYSPLGFVGNLLMLQALPGVPAWNAPSWSVSCELAAYLVFPLAAGLLVRVRRLLAIALGAVVVALLVYAIRWLTVMPEFSPTLFFWVRIAGEFTFGCLLWAVWRGLAARRLWDLVGLVTFLSAAVLLRVESGSWKAWWVIGLIGLFVLATASCSGVLRSVLASRPLVYGGRISYSVYLIHFPLVVVLGFALPPGELASEPLVIRVAVAVGLLAAPVVAGAFLHHLVEEPARSWLRGRRRPARPVPFAEPDAPGESSRSTCDNVRA